MEVFPVKVNLTKRDDITPLCPNCGAELNDMYYQEKGAGFMVSKTVIYFCPYCSKVIGIARSNMG